MMRQYTLVFMEQRIGAPRPTPVPGHAGVAMFTAEDEEAALEYIKENLIERVKDCIRADLSSLKIVPDPAANGGTRLVDDTHASPQFQDTYVRFNAATKTIEADWESTRTTLISDLAVARSGG